MHLDRGTAFINQIQNEIKRRQTVYLPQGGNHIKKYLKYTIKKVKYQVCSKCINSEVSFNETERKNDCNANFLQNKTPGS